MCTDLVLRFILFPSKMEELAQPFSEETRHTMPQLFSGTLNPCLLGGFSFTRVERNEVRLAHVGYGTSEFVSPSKSHWFPSPLI